MAASQKTKGEREQTHRNDAARPSQRFEMPVRASLGAPKRETPCRGALVERRLLGRGTVWRQPTTGRRETHHCCCGRRQIGSVRIWIRTDTRPLSTTQNVSNPSMAPFDWHLIKMHGYTGDMIEVHGAMHCFVVAQSSRVRVSVPTHRTLAEE